MKDAQAVLLASAMYWLGLNSVSDPDPWKDNVKTWLVVTLAITTAWGVLEFIKFRVGRRKSNAS